MNKLGGIVVLCSFYVCLTSLSDRWENLRWFLKVFVVSVAVQNTAACAAFLWCKYTGSDHPVLMILLSDGVDRLAGMLVDANAYGGLLAVAFAITLLGGDRDNPLLPRWLWIACLLSLATGLLLTSSRSAWIGVGFLTLCAGFRSPRLLFVVAIMTLAGAGLVAYTMGTDAFDQFVTVSSRQNTIDERVEISQHAWEMFRAHPLLGAGIGAYSEEHGIIVHNSALWFLAEFGIVGFVVFTGFMGWFLIKGVAAYRSAPPGQRSIVAGLLAAHLAVLGLSLGIEASYQRYWWFALGLLGAAYTLAVRDAETGGQPSCLPEGSANENVCPTAEAQLT